MKVLNNLDLNKNQILNVTLQNLTSAPVSPVIGQIYFNTTDNNAYVYGGSQWKILSESFSNIDGGTPNSVYTITQSIDGGTV